MNIVLNTNQSYKLSELAQAVENSTDDLFYVVKQVDGNDVSFAITREQLIQGISGGDPTIQDGGANVGTRPNINFIEGTNITFTIADDAPNDRVNITVNAGGGGGGIVETVVAGTGIAVDATDPANPIVSAEIENTAEGYLSNWLAGEINGKTVVLSGDSTTLEANLLRYRQQGATIRRPFPGGVTISQSGTVVTCSNTLFSAKDVTGDNPGVFYFDTSETATVTTFNSANSLNVAESQTVAATNGYLEFAPVNAEGVFKGVTIYHCGDNGQTALGHLTTGAYPITYTKSLNADLYVICFGINDVRLGGVNQATLESRLDAIVNSIRTDLPDTSIMLRIPNPFLSTDPTSNGLIVPQSAAQDYSDIMFGAYRTREGIYPNVFVADAPREVFGGDTCPALSPLMRDNIHPDEEGQRGISDLVMKYAGFLTPIYSETLATAVIAESPLDPWTDYRNVLEKSGFFNVVTEGTIILFGTGFIDISPKDLINIQDVRRGDILWQDDAEPFVLTAPGANLSLAQYIRIGMTSPVALTAGKVVRIYRHTGYGDANILVRLQQPDTLPFAVPIRVVTAGTGFLDFAGQEPGETRLASITTADTLVVAGEAVVALTGSTLIAQNQDTTSIRVLKSGLTSSYNGKLGYVFGTFRQQVVPVGIPVIPRNGQIWLDSGGIPKIRANGVTNNILQSGDTTLDGITGLIQTVTATTYNLMIRAPFAGTITAVGGVVSVGTCDIRAGINGTPLGVVTSISSTYAEQVHAASNTFVVNDIITLVISNLATDPADLDFVIKMTRTI